MTTELSPIETEYRIQLEKYQKLYDIHQEQFGEIVKTAGYHPEALKSHNHMAKLHQQLMNLHKQVKIHQSLALAKELNLITDDKVERFITGIAMSVQTLTGKIVKYKGRMMIRLDDSSRSIFYNKRYIPISNKWNKITSITGT